MEQAGLLHDLSIVSGSSEVDCLLPLPGECQAFVHTERRPGGRSAQLAPAHPARARYAAAPGVAPKASRHAHKRSLSSTLWALSVEYQPRKIVQVGRPAAASAREQEEERAPRTAQPPPVATPP